MQTPDASVRTGADIAAYGASMREGLARWWAGRAAPVGDDTVETFQGQQSLHWFLERSTWHSAQHTRQIEEVLKRSNIEPLLGLSPEILEGLPLPKRVWE
jgi:hypothetical protein